MYDAALELLREATGVVLEAKDMFSGMPRQIKATKYLELDPKVVRAGDRPVPRRSGVSRPAGDRHPKYDGNRQGHSMEHAMTVQGR